MSDSPLPIGTTTGLPKGSPPALAIRPSRLETTRLEKENRYETARRASKQLKDAFKALQSEVEPSVAPDQELPDVDPEASLRLASLGIELALQEKETIRLERELIASERDAGSITHHAANQRLREAGQRYYSAGDDLWRHQKKKMRLADPGPEEVPILDLRRHGVSDCILALYRKSDGLSRSKGRPRNWRRDALDYYNANGADHGEEDDVWCHVSGRWLPKHDTIAAHIVPFFLDFDCIGEVLFGERAQSLDRAGNALCMAKQIERWFDNYHLVIVPVDGTEDPITRWRTDVISPSIMNAKYSGEFRCRELDGKELTFHNEKRPVSRFLYFHFFMALICIRDTKRIGWQDTWAKYYDQRPFPTPGPYLRKSMLMALACHFETTDLKVINSWMTDNGFETPLQMTNDEVVETARRVHLAVEDRATRAEDGNGNGSDDESHDGSDNNDSSLSSEEED
ncbi:hypothetical protein E4U17_000463 [Claviceps sp. LM77 group G4]|nr:hypothetical protein E4U17_000463 [Claviceps sp. LM77 group G4]